jgi:hypothetical protein
MAFAIVAANSAGCRAPLPTPVRGIGVAPPPARPPLVEIARRALQGHRRARHAARVGAPDLVELAYEAAVFAYAAQEAALTAGQRADAACFRAIYNANLADCLAAASCQGRFDPRRALTIAHGPARLEVPVVHRAFVWGPGDFDRLVDAREAPRNPNRHRCHRRAGLGAPQIVVRCNPRETASDRFLRASQCFPATAVLIPDLEAWLAPFPDAPTSVDLLTQHGQLLEAMEALPRNPLTRVHTIAGRGLLPPGHAHGDLVVSLESAHTAGAVSELWVPATHFGIYYHEQTVAELSRILDEHLAGAFATPPR